MRSWFKQSNCLTLCAFIALATQACGEEIGVPVGRLPSSPLVPQAIVDAETGQGLPAPNMADDLSAQRVGAQHRTTIREIGLGAVFTPLPNRERATQKLDANVHGESFIYDRDPYFGTANQMLVHWMPPNFTHRTLYFEDVTLERFGVSWGPVLQPAASGVRFFYDACWLPLRRITRPCCVEESILGYPRAGSPPESIDRASASGM